MANYVFDLPTHVTDDHYLGVVPTAAIYGVPSFKSVEMVENENHLPRCDILKCF